MSDRVNDSMSGAALFVRCLENEGVECIFGVPGEENLDFLDALSRSPIQLVLTRHEQAAGFMAATYGRLTGKAGVCLATLGPGATNLVTAAAYANLGAMPMLMITGQKPIKSSKQGQFQIVDVVDMMQPLTKFTKQVVSADRIPSLVREAFRVAQEERPGAVHLELPEDIARESTERLPFEPSSVRRPEVDSKVLGEAVAAIQKAKHPLLLVGAGANRNRACKALRALVDELEIPFVSTQMGKGVIDETHRLSVGNAALSEGDFVHRAIGQSDLILNVGHDVVEKPPFFMDEGDRTVIHVHFVSAEVDPVYFPQIELIGDIAHTIDRLRATCSASSRWQFTPLLKAKDAMDAHIGEGANRSGFPMDPQRLVRVVRDAVSDSGIIALDNGIYKLWFARNYPAYEPNTVLLDNALASMGAGLPSAMAAKRVHPECDVTAICGDGGFMMNSQELETAVRLELDLVVLVLNDASYGMIRWKQENMGFRDWGLTFGNPDFVCYAQSYGANGHRVEREGDLAPLMRQCHDQGGVHLIDVPVDYSENDRILNHEIKERAAALTL